jgi:septal ring factor EnvC (AmiA/AmiB activator)
MSEENQGGASIGAMQDVGRIREIIFGSQMRDYEQRFRLLQRDLEGLQGELEALREQVSAQGKEQDKKLQALRDDTRQSDDDLRAEMRQTADRLTTDKVDRSTLGDLLIELGNRLKQDSALGSLLETLDGS